MRRIFGGALLLGAFAAEGAVAQYCHDLWFSRNAMWNDAGYCFSSPLGQAVFDNSDCTTEAPVLSELNARIVKRIVEVEAEFGCTVDSSVTSLDGEQVFSLEHRWAVASQPILGPSELTEGSCYGFQRPRLPVRSAPETDAEILGWIETGDGFRTNHDSWEGWDFVTVSKPGDGSWEGEITVAGWIRPADIPSDANAPSLLAKGWRKATGRCRWAIVSAGTSWLGSARTEGPYALFGMAGIHGRLARAARLAAGLARSGAEGSL